jgi:YD repeat-containing protein
MPRGDLLRLVSLVALAGIAVNCGSGSGGSNTGSNGGPTSPTNPGQPTGPVCRTYSTAASVQTTTSGTNIVFNALESASFDASTNRITVETKFANGAPCSTAISSYNSVADFVDEVRVNPPIDRQTGNSSTSSGQCGTGSGSATFTYDAQRRLTKITSNLGVVTAYSAWDASGRPTAGSLSNGTTITFVYDDAARTWTQTQVPTTGTRSVSTETFDANGIPIKSVVVQGNVTTTTTFTTTSTAQVCR